MRYSYKRILRKMYNMRDMLYISGHRKLFTKYTIYGVCLFLAVTISFSPQVMFSKNQNIYERPMKFPTDMKYILFWKAKEKNLISGKNKDNKFLISKKEPLFPTGQTLFVKQKCPHINCYITYDKKLLEHDWYYDAVVFDIREIRHHKVDDINRTRAAYQKYIFRSLEASDTHYLCHKSFDDFFNWTWTYRLDSDIPHPFLNVYNMNNTLVGPRMNMTWLTVMKNVDRFGSKVKNKKKAVAWILNNCKNMKRHEDFYQKLKAELESWNYTLDTYGSCGQKPCPSGALYKCYKMIEKKYFFQLVTEDVLADDYVTEKVVKTMQLVIIPIVLGGANYTRFLPPGSYLDIRYFDIKKLGAIIDFLIKRKPTYTKFFDWKNHYALNLRPRNYVCDLCAKLNEEYDTSKVKTGLRKWWNADFEDVCLRNHLYYKFAKNESE